MHVFPNDIHPLYLSMGPMGDILVHAPTTERVSQSLITKSTVERVAQPFIIELATACVAPPPFSHHFNKALS